MNFSEALNEVIMNKSIAQRRSHYFDHDSDEVFGPWSEWIRIKVDEGATYLDSLVYFETNKFDETTKRWLLTWDEDNISLEDMLADDWVIAEDGGNG